MEGPAGRKAAAATTGSIAASMTCPVKREPQSRPHCMVLLPDCPEDGLFAPIYSVVLPAFMAVAGVIQQHSWGLQRPS